MTDIKKNRNDEYMDTNLDRLLELGNPIPEMPEDIKNRIRSKLILLASESRKDKFFSFRWVLLPLSAAAVLIFFLFIPWKGDMHGAISWADVRRHLNNIKTVVSKIDLITTYGENRTTISGKVYHKDPGLTRSEIYSESNDGDALFPKPQSINVIKRVPGRSEWLMLQPGFNQAEWKTEIFRTAGPEYPPTQIVDIATENWKNMKKLTEDDTRLIGDRFIDGVSAVGFSFEGPVNEIIQSPEAIGRAHGNIYVRHEDGLPLFIEVTYQTRQGQGVRLEARDIKWNVPLEDALFSFCVPKGWQLKRTRVEKAEYAGAKLAPGVGLDIGLDGKEPLVRAEDIAGIVMAEQITDPKSNAPDYLSVTVQLKKEAYQHLRRQAKEYSKKIIVVNFNGLSKSVTRVDENVPEQLTFDVTRLNLSLDEIEKRYFTKTTTIYKGTEK